MLRRVLAEGLGQLGGGGGLALGDVEEDGRDLQDVVEVGLDAGAPLEHLVLVARDLEALLGFLQAHQRHVGQPDLVRGLVDHARHGGGWRGGIRARPSLEMCLYSRERSRWSYSS